VFGVRLRRLAVPPLSANGLDLEEMPRAAEPDLGPRGQQVEGRGGDTGVGRHGGGQRGPRSAVLAEQPADLAGGDELE
jgi:hypothetical protein